MRIDQGRVGETTSMYANRLVCESTCMRKDRQPLRLLLIRTVFSTTWDVNSMTNESNSMTNESLPASVLDLDIGRHNDMLNLYNSIFGHSDADKTQLPCEFCGDLFPVDTLIMHQVRMQSSQKTVHQCYSMSTLQRTNLKNLTVSVFIPFLFIQHCIFGKNLTLCNLEPSTTNSPCIFITIMLGCSGIRLIFFV